MASPQLVDRFGRVHDYLRISLTERCNLRCFYCMPECGIELRDNAVFMTEEETIGIAKIFTELGVKKIRLTGGEPLVKKNAHELILGMSSLPVKMAITSNGVLVDRFIQTFEKAGLKTINISLDSIDKYKFNEITRRDYHDRIINNIHLLLSKGFRVKLNAVVIRGVNEVEIPQFIELTKSFDLSVRFIEFMPFDGNQWNWDKMLSYKEIMEHVASAYDQDDVIRLNDEPNDTSKNYKIKGFKGSFGIISPVSSPFCESCNRLRLTADGRLKNCLFGQEEFNLLEPFRNGEDIKPIILNAVQAKHKERGGITALDHTFADQKWANRSMTTIGG
ncbi:MAG: GTP 3',8-cyclase MoaA [Flavobacteriales bacterium]|nr:GTP 3',8-cyclase MoaA [Flavobacteriales bacterium]